MKTPWIHLPSPSTGPPRPSTGRRRSRSPVPKPRAHRRDLAARRRSGHSCHMCPLLSHPKVVEWEQATAAARRRSTHRIHVLGGRGSPPWWRGGGVRIGSNLHGRATAGSQKGRGGAPAPWWIRSLGGRGSLPWWRGGGGARAGFGLPDRATAGSPVAQ
jgi:hypothetical protein